MKRILCLILAINLLNIADMALTMVGLAMGGGRVETNPALQQIGQQEIILKTVLLPLLTGLFAIAYWQATREGAHTARKFVLSLFLTVCGYMALVLVQNVCVLAARPGPFDVFRAVLT